MHRLSGKHFFLQLTVGTHAVRQNKEKIIALLLKSQLTDQEQTAFRRLLESNLRIERRSHQDLREQDSRQKSDSFTLLHVSEEVIPQELDVLILTIGGRAEERERTRCKSRGKEENKVPLYLSFSHSLTKIQFVQVFLFSCSSSFCSSCQSSEDLTKILYLLVANLSISSFRDTKLPQHLTSF